MSTKVILIRHGQSEWNADLKYDKFNGRTDVQLSQKGFNQIEVLSRSLASYQIAAVYSSPLIRAFETAKAIAEPHRLNVECVPELIEIDFGKWEGLTMEEITKRYPQEFEEWANDPAISRAHDGESGYDVAARVLPFFLQVVKSFDCQTIVVVAHKVINRIVLCHWLGIPIRNYRRFIPQRVSSLNVLDIEFTRATWVESINDVSFLVSDWS